MTDQQLIQSLLDAGVYKNPAQLAKACGYTGAAQIYRVIKGDGKLGNMPRQQLESAWQRSQQPAPVFAPVLQDTGDGQRSLTLETRDGGFLCIPLIIKQGRWVANE